MSSAEVRTSRMPEIENIALREALKDFGLEAVEPGEDVVLHVERGPKGLFVTHAHRNLRTGSRALVEGSDALLEKAVESFEKLVRENTPSGECWTATLADESFEIFCQENPDKAVELANASLARSARMMTEIVEDTRRDLIEIAVRRERIDRTQAEIRELLKHLVEDAPDERR